jgi:hypothetical protein
MPSAEERYGWVMRDAKEDVFLVAARRAIDTRLITVEFDAERGSGQFIEHILRISIKETDLSVADHHIPHDWLSVGTGFIDPRLGRLVNTLLNALTTKAEATGLLL